MMLSTSNCFDACNTHFNRLPKPHLTWIFIISMTAQVSHHFQRWAFHPQLLHLEIRNCPKPKERKWVVQDCQNPSHWDGWRIHIPSRWGNWAPLVSQPKSNNKVLVHKKFDIVIYRIYIKFIWLYYLHDLYNYITYAVYTNIFLT